MNTFTELTEEQKLRIGRFRDEFLFKKYFLDNFSALKQLAYSIVNNFEEAEEISSELLWKIWNMEEELLRIESVAAYLNRSVRNSSLNFVRQKSRKLEFVVLDNIECEDFNTPESIIISSEKISLIEEAVNNLPAKTKSAFLLVKENNMSYKEAAESLQISPKTVDRHMQIALKKIYTILKKKNIF